MKKVFFMILSKLFKIVAKNGAFLAVELGEYLYQFFFIRIQNKLKLYLKLISLNTLLHFLDSMEVKYGGNGKSLSSYQLNINTYKKNLKNVI